MKVLLIWPKFDSFSFWNFEQVCALAGVKYGEGRLFAQAEKDMPDGARDQISAGIQFKPERPAADVLRDLLRVMRHSFDPREYFARCQSVATRLGTEPQLFLGAYIFFRNMRTFFRLIARMLKLPKVRGPFFRGLLRVMLKNPKGIEAYVTLAVLYVHFESMLDYCYGQLAAQMHEIERLGEEAWLEAKLPKDRPAPPPLNLLPTYRT